MTHVRISQNVNPAVFAQFEITYTTNGIVTRQVFATSWLQVIAELALDPMDDAGASSEES